MDALQIHGGKGNTERLNGEWQVANSRVGDSKVVLFKFEEKKNSPQPKKINYEHINKLNTISKIRKVIQIIISDKSEGF